MHNVDVESWVELQFADGTWRPLDARRYVGSRDNGSGHEDVVLEQRVGPGAVADGPWRGGERRGDEQDERGEERGDHAHHDERAGAEAVRRVAGQLAGSVKAIDFLPVDGDTLRNLKVTVEIDQRIREQVRGDSKARLKNLGLLGDKYIDISPGTPRYGTLAAGDTLPMGPSLDYEAIVGQASGAVGDMVQLTADLKTITGGIVRGEGALGQLVTDRRLYDELTGTLVVDCVNPLGFDKQGAYPLEVPDGSAAQEAQRILPGSTVVGAFHNVSARLLDDPSVTHIPGDVLVLGEPVQQGQLRVDALGRDGAGGLAAHVLGEPDGLGLEVRGGGAHGAGVRGAGRDRGGHDRLLVVGGEAGNGDVRGTRTAAVEHTRAGPGRR